MSNATHVQACVRSLVTSKIRAVSLSCQFLGMNSRPTVKKERYLTCIRLESPHSKVEVERTKGRTADLTLLLIARWFLNPMFVRKRNSAVSYSRLSVSCPRCDPSADLRNEKSRRFY